MSVSTNGSTRTFTATIGQTNERGLQIQERPGVWLNFSKFGPTPVVPPLGASARITIDARGFIRTIEPLDGPDDEQPALPFAAPPPRPTSVSDTITRLAVLKAAARYHAGQEGADVLATAAAWERWVRQDIADRATGTEL